MRTLYISRHAEADHHYNTDFYRCLTACGEQEADWLGQYLLKRALNIDVILTSPAQRALTTAQIIAQTTQVATQKLLTIPELYNADVDTLLQCIHSLDNQYHYPLLIAHNPGLSNLVHYLSDTDVGHLPTCGFCGLDFDVEHWNEIQRGLGHLRVVSCPEIH